MLELTEEQRRALDQHADQPLEVIDPRTGRIYVLVAAERYPRGPGLPEAIPDDPPIVIPPMIALAKATFRRDLPMLLQNKKWRGKYVCYAGDERIGIAKHDDELIRECIRRDIPDDHFYIGVIEPNQPPDDEEVRYGLLEFDDDESDPCTEGLSG